MDTTRMRIESLENNFRTAKKNHLNDSEFFSVIRYENRLKEVERKHRNGSRAGAFIWMGIMTICLAGPLQAWGFCGCVAGIKFVLAVIFAELSD